MIKHTPCLPLTNMRCLSRHKQSGAALIAVIFIITALAALGGLMSQMIIMSSEETINEWYSAQALYAAESGIEWAIWDIQNGGSGVISNGTVENNRAWMTTSVSSVTINVTTTLYTINSMGSAGSNATNPRAQRKIAVQFMP